MPAPSEVLSNLTAIANETIWLAVAWHVALLAALVAYVRGWRPTWRSAALLLVTPLASVAVVAAVFGNVFNTLAFGALSVALLAIALRMPDSPARRGADWQVAAGHAFIGIGVLYPHFLDHGPLAYVVAAPFGSLPCPTLAVLVGFTLLAGGFTKAWNLTLVFAAVFYGTIGAAQLGVWIDATLVLGGLVLAWTAARLMISPRYARSLR